MLAFIKRHFQRFSSGPGFASHREKVWGSTRQRSQEHSRRLEFEQLDSRMLLAAVANFGDITDPARLFAVNDQVPPDSPRLDGDFQTAQSDQYFFSLSRPAEVHVALSDLQRTNLFEDPGARLVVFTPFIPNSDNSDGDRTFIVGKDVPAGTTGDLQVSLPSGNYEIFVGWDLSDNPGGGFIPSPLLKSYDLAIHADTAPVAFSGGNPLATEGRDLGVLLTSSGTNIQEYIGLGDGGGNPPALEDQVDMYLFDLVKQGTVEVNITSAVSAGGAMDFTLFRDSNGDGVFDTGSSLESIATRTEVRSGQTKTIRRTLEPGRYGIAVFVNGTFAQDNNYRLRTTYTVADGAGNTLATATPVGALGDEFKTLNDYISPDDQGDFYKFDTIGNGPFVFEGTLSGMAPGSNFEMDLFLDLDGDGSLDIENVISSTRVANANEALVVPYNAPGTYFVKVRHTDGEGVYTLHIRNRNTDLAGNSLGAAAKNLGNFVFNDLADQVSSIDRADFYRFELAVPSAFDAQLSTTSLGTNANLLLIRDINGDTTIDQNEIVAGSSNAGNAPEHIGRILAPGVYFVRVLQIAGAPRYHLRLVHDRVGNLLANAQAISQGGGSNLEFLGPEDDTDIYKFSLGTPRLIGVKVEFNNEPLLIRIGRDTNGNGQLDQNELRLSKTIGAGTGGFESVNVAGVDNFLVVGAVVQDEGTLYRVTLFNATPDNAGDSLGRARNIGVLGPNQIFADFVGDGSVDLLDDLDDFYKFTLGNNGPFHFQSIVNNLAPFATNRSAVIELIRDDNRDFRRSESEVVISTTAHVISGTNVPGVINTILDVPGDYYLRVKRNSGQVSYSLNTFAISQDTAGNTMDATARDLGVLVPGTVNSLGNFVGRIDLTDVFRFSINSPGELVAGLNGGENVLYQVIRDIDRDGVIDTGETLGAALGNRQLHGIFLPAEDNNYFVRTQAVFGDDQYALNLTFSNQTPFDVPFVISPTLPTDIKAVRFDKGGEGVSWHDTTPDNTGDQPGFRNVENIDVDVSNTVDVESIGRRVTNTAPGEFLEYTIHVTAGGFYDFDVRVSSPDVGATFHLEIDNVSLSSPVSIPDTNSPDNMVTVVGASNVFLTAGPHILRLEIDSATGVNNDFAGSFNFIKVRPASAGTFRLTPQSSTVEAWTNSNLSLSWTVPVGGWRVLRHVDLRLSNVGGEVIWIRFDEATNSMSLYNQSQGRFGCPRQVGTNNVLHSPLAQVFLKTTTIAANGADAPTVVISIDMMFTGRARGRWTIEAAATDDPGHRDPFKTAGEIFVV